MQCLLGISIWRHKICRQVSGDTNIHCCPASGRESGKPINIGWVAQSGIPSRAVTWVTVGQHDPPSVYSLYLVSYYI